jgi:glycosyltransferase involved in cell wall biosynthesis
VVALPGDSPAASVAVIIPARNRGAVICRAIRSALGQTFPVSEVLVVDDASSDDTANAAMALARSDRRVKYIRLPSRRGAQAARIVGLQNAKSDYIAFLDSDDELVPDSVERRLAVFLSGSASLGLVYGDCMLGEVDGTPVMRFPMLRGDSSRFLSHELSLCNYSSMMIRASCLVDVGYPTSSFPAWQDDDMVMTIGGHYGVFHCGSVVAVARGSGVDSISADRLKQAHGCWSIVQKYRARIIHDHGCRHLMLWYLRAACTYVDAYGCRIQGAFADSEASVVATSRISRARWACGHAMSDCSRRILRHLGSHFDHMYA